MIEKIASWTVISVLAICIVLSGLEIIKQANKLDEYKRTNDAQTTRINELDKQVEINFQTNKAESDSARADMHKEYRELCERLPSEWNGAFPVC